MASLLSNLVNNLPEGIHKFKCKYEYNDEKFEICEINTNIVNASLNIQTLKMI